ncbi:hypothetical protein BV53_04685 [Candidatus Synechococcus spongiarum LMB bulk15N]|uniref:Uncharacterized protein n=1 Tax=Candidatus Synechococcus spongiarum LMB bulk15N TaxID=1943583 RepID=A0A1T1D2J9_9SYNE|nr:hypothetical protein BV53_04685 [Candidatus Synechococcus spongiarum LMB bulk15N]
MVCERGGGAVSVRLTATQPDAASEPVVTAASFATALLPVAAVEAYRLSLVLPGAIVRSVGAAGSACARVTVTV